MDIFEAIVLGITQGLTEFLPISSSGHLILVPWLFGWESSGLAFDAALHLGTLVAVFAYFRDDIWAMIKAIPLALRSPKAVLSFSATVKPIDASTGRFEGMAAAKIGLLIVLGSIPGGIVGLASQSAIDDYFHDASTIDRAVATVAVLLISFGILLWVADRLGSRSRGLTSLSLRDAVVIGSAQVLALMPGVSRSGVTMTAGLFRGLTRSDAARFSFLLGVPLITGAGVKGLYDIAQASPTGDEIAAMVAGLASAAISGFLAIWALLRFLQRSSTGVFVVYRLAVGAGVLVALATGLK